MTPEKQNSSIIPTGEAQVDRVHPLPPPASSVPIDDTPTPVVEHEVQVAPEDDPDLPEPTAPVQDEATVTTEELLAVPEMLASEPEPLPPKPNVSCSAADAVPAPLQEYVPVPIPVRVDQLHTDHKRLRNDLDTLECALKKPMS